MVYVVQDSGAGGEDVLEKVGRLVMGRRGVEVGAVVVGLSSGSELAGSVLVGSMLVDSEVVGEGLLGLELVGSGLVGSGELVGVSMMTVPGLVPEGGIVCVVATGPGVVIVVQPGDGVGDGVSIITVPGTVPDGGIV